VTGAWGWQPYHLHEPIVLKSGIALSTAKQLQEPWFWGHLSYLTCVGVHKGIPNMTTERCSRFSVQNCCFSVEQNYGLVSYTYNLQYGNWKSFAIRSLFPYLNLFQLYNFCNNLYSPSLIRAVHLFAWQFMAPRSRESSEMHNGTFHVFLQKYVMSHANSLYTLLPITVFWRFVYTYDMTYLLNAIGLPPICTVHIYTQSTHRTTQNK
jgi:hypothetical protein